MDARYQLRYLSSQQNPGNNGNSEYRGHIRGGHVRDELTPLMIFLTTDFDYRCAKLGTIFTEKRDLTDDEITKVSF